MASIIRIRRSTGTAAPSSLNFGELGLTIGVGQHGNKGGRLFAGDNSNNPGKVDSDDPNTKPPMYPLQQELELQKKDAGKDLAHIDNIVQDADEQAEDEIARKDGPLVQQPETTKGDNPGVPANMKSKQPQNESEFVQTLKKLSGQI